MKLSPKNKRVIITSIIIAASTPLWVIFIPKVVNTLMCPNEGLCVPYVSIHLGLLISAFIVPLVISLLLVLIAITRSSKHSK